MPEECLAFANDVHDLANDTDGDYVSNPCDPNPHDGPLADADFDLVLNETDNCPLVPNPDQAGSPGASVGDACDPDAGHNPATVVVSPDEYPLPPITLLDELMVGINETVEIDVLDNDSDPEGDLDETSLRIETQGSLGNSVVVQGADGGMVLSYTSGAVAGTDVVDYVICDETDRCARGSVTVTVLGLADCTITGTSGDDVLEGTNGPDVICGLGGDDVINGLGGDDVIMGGRGADVIDAGDGDDVVYGGRGADEIRGGSGNDVLRGNRGQDSIWGGDGDDTIRGGNHADVLYGNEGGDTIYGGRGPDEMRGGRGDDVLYGRQGADILRGGRGSDVLRGNRGVDELFGGKGDDLLIGGRGFDSADGGGGFDECRSESRSRCES